MRPTQPEGTLSFPAEITPELAVSCADKMNLLFKVQMLGRSVPDLDSALRLLTELSRELIPHDRTALFWSDDPQGSLTLWACEGFDQPTEAEPIREALCTSDSLANPKPVLGWAFSEDLDPRLSRLLRRTHAEGVLQMPLYLDERVHGALVLLRSSGRFTFTEAHLLRVFALGFEGILESLVQGGLPAEFPFSDPLTGLFNRRYFEQQLEREVDRSRRNGEPLSVLSIRLQDWQGYRRLHGRAAFEALLLGASGALRGACRKSDTLACLRPHEFAVILPRTPKRMLSIVTKRVLAGLAAVDATARSDLRLAVAGVSYPEDASSLEPLLEACAKAIDLAGESPSGYFQFPSETPRDHGGLLEETRADFLHEPLLEPRQLLKLMTRLCLEAVPADRVSVMVREHESLAVHVTYGFNGDEELVRLTRIPLTARTISTWVAQRREPLLVRSAEELEGLPGNGQSAYRSESFLSYPLIDESGELLGVVHFSNPSDGQPFSWANVERFRALAPLLTRYLALAREFGDRREQFLEGALCALVELREKQIPGMERHSADVARLAEATARELGLSEAEATSLGVSSRLHDLGELSYRTQVMSKNGPFSAEERTLNERHPLVAWKFLEDLPLSHIDREAILYHHERIDGSGYFGKRGAEIPESAKILAAADVYQAMTSPRPHRPAATHAEALSFLEEQKGALFDPRVVEALKGVLTRSRGTKA